ncbi:MAG: transposase [Proteobacteria bacterium]|nr:transposase [Pseudomonadota bacterium]
MDPVNILPFDKQVACIAALTEGCSIRSVERLTGVHRDTIMRLGARIGAGCLILHDQMMRDLNVSRLELDELWSFVARKQARVKTKRENKISGDQYTFIGMADTSKAIVSHLTGKRDQANTRRFIRDLRERVLGAPEICTDGWPAYPGAIEDYFGADCRYGVMVKNYAAPVEIEAARRYAPAQVVSVTRQHVIGRPTHISTSYIERANLSVRTGQRRFTRLALGYSKSLDNHRAAVGLFVAHYNLVRVHMALRVTPALALGVTDHVWSMAELVEAALAATEPPPEPKGRQVGPFRVIDGGRKD